jgi:hypothetical protein
VLLLLLLLLLVVVVVVVVVAVVISFHLHINLCDFHFPSSFCTHILGAFLFPPLPLRAPAIALSLFSKALSLYPLINVNKQASHTHKSNWQNNFLIYLINFENKRKLMGST